jgi:hypothetical protein
MAVGFPAKVSYANGDVFSASDINDTNGTLNLLGASVAYTAGKNKIINGDFRFNQRNFTSVTTSDTYGFDRFMQRFSGACTYSAQAFTPGTAPAAPYEAINFARLVSSSQVGATDFAGLVQRMEDVRTLANQVVTLSFWAKASTGTPNIGVTFVQNFGSGGSAGVNTSPAVKTITTSWVRYSFQITVPSISGKTVGTNSMAEAYIFTSCGTTISALGYAAVGLQNVTIDIWGVQLETGSTATAFQTATGTIQGELAACQRYYNTMVSGATNLMVGNGAFYSSSQLYVGVFFPVSMRIAPSLVATSGTDYYAVDRNAGTDLFNSFSIAYATNETALIYNLSEISSVAGQAGAARTNNASASIAFNAEL